jgi:hypothetical protein
MKKFPIFLVFTGVLALIFLQGCSKSTENNPVPAATEIPVVLPVSQVVANFETNSTTFYVNGVTATVSTGTDSPDGGTSQIISSGIVGGNASFGSYAFGVTATIKAELPYSATAGAFTKLDAGYLNIGYITVSVNFSNPVDIYTNNTVFSHRHVISNNADMDYRIYFKSGNGNYCYTANNSFFTTIVDVPRYFTGLTAGGAGYTPADVLKGLSEIIFVVRYHSVGVSQKSVEYYLDLMAISAP